MRRARYVLALAGLIAIAACSNVGHRSTRQIAEPVCIALAGLEAQINTLRALDPSTATLQEYQTAAYNVSGMAQTVVAQARVLANAEAGQLDNSLRTLQKPPRRSRPERLQPRRKTSSAMRSLRPKCSRDA